MKASSADSQLTRTPSVITDSTESTRPKLSASPGRMRPAGTTSGGSGHYCIDVGVVPHVERARRAGTDGNGENRDHRQQRIDGHRCGNQADKGGEHHQRHDARLQGEEMPAVASDMRKPASSIIGSSTRPCVLKSIILLLNRRARWRFVFKLPYLIFICSTGGKAAAKAAAIQVSWRPRPMDWRWRPASSGRLNTP